MPDKPKPMPEGWLEPDELATVLKFLFAEAGYGVVNPTEHGLCPCSPHRVLQHLKAADVLLKQQADRILELEKVLRKMTDGWEYLPGKRGVCVDGSVVLTMGEVRKALEGAGVEEGADAK